RDFLSYTTNRGLSFSNRCFHRRLESLARQSLLRTSVQTADPKRLPSPRRRRALRERQNQLCSFAVFSDNSRRPPPFDSNSPRCVVAPGRKIGFLARREGPF